MAAEGLFVLVLLGILAFPLVLYCLVRAEHGRGEEMDRTDAERVARRDTPETVASSGRRRGDHDEDTVAGAESREER